MEIFKQNQVSYLSQTYPMNPPRIPFSLSFLTQLTKVPESFRVFLIGSGLSFYGLVLYEFFPELILNTNNAITYFITPVVTIVGVGIALPRVLPIIMEKNIQKNHLQSLLNQKRPNQMMIFLMN